MCKEDILTGQRDEDHISKMDHAVFMYNKEASLEQLTVWLSAERAFHLKDSDTFFPHYTKMVLKKVLANPSQTSPEALGSTISEKEG